MFTRRTSGYFKWMTVVFTVMVALALSGAAHALTPAGTQITSTATVTWEDAEENAYDQDASIIVEVLQVAGASLDAVTSATRVIRPDTSNTHNVLLTNTGNETDTFDVEVTLDPTAEAAGWSVAPLTAVQILAQDADVEIEITLTAPEDAEDGDSASFTVTATSRFDPTVSDSQVFDTWVTDTYLEVTITAEKDGAPLEENDEVVPGDEINYTIDITNDGTGDADNISVVYQVPDYVTYDPDSIEIVDQDGVDISEDYDVVYDDTTGTLTITSKDGTELAGGDSVIITFDVTVDQYATPGDEIEGTLDVVYDDSSGAEQTPPLYEFPTFTIDEDPAVSVTIVGNDEELLIAGTEVEVVFTVKNEGNVTDDFAITLQELPDDPSIWTLYLDVNGDGSVLDPVVFPLATGDLLPGETVQYIAKATVPANEDGWDSALTLTATSTQDPLVSDEDTFTLELSAPKMTIVLSGVAIDDPQDAPDPSSGVDVLQEPAGKVLFTVVAKNEGREIAKNVVISMDIPDHMTFVVGSIDLTQTIAGFNPVFSVDQIISTGIDFAVDAEVEFNFAVTID